MKLCHKLNSRFFLDKLTAQSATAGEDQGKRHLRIATGVRLVTSKLSLWMT